MQIADASKSKDIGNFFAQAAAPSAHQVPAESGPIIVLKAEYTYPLIFLAKFLDTYIKGAVRLFGDLNLNFFGMPGSSIPKHI